MRQTRRRPSATRDCSQAALAPTRLGDAFCAENIGNLESLSYSGFGSRRRGRRALCSLSRRCTLARRALARTRSARLQRADVLPISRRHPGKFTEARAQSLHARTCACLNLLTPKVHRRRSAAEKNETLAEW